MGTNNFTIRRDIAAINNLSMGYDTDGNVSSPFMGTTEYALMGGSGLLAFATGRKQKPMLNGRLVSRMQYGKGLWKANFGSWSGFNNIEFVDTRLQKMQGIMQKATPQWPTKLNSHFEAYSAEGKQVLKTLFEDITKAPNRAEFNRILSQTPQINGQPIVQNGRVLTNADLYKRLIKHMPSDVVNKLQNIVKYNEMYGPVIRDFEAAQNTLRSGTGLAKGQIDALHQSFANARQAENSFITATEGVLGADRKVGAGARAIRSAKMSAGVKNAMTASKTLRRFSRGAGKLGGVLMIGLTAATAGMETYAAVKNAPEGKKWRDGGRQLAKSGGRAACELGGAWAGMKAGAAIGAFGGPVGAAIGGIIGSFVGWAAGSWLADKSKFMSKSVVEERIEEQNKQIEKNVAKAFQENDLETLDAYTAEFKEYELELDEEGKPILDENKQPKYKTDANGNPIPKLDENGNFIYAKVSDDPKKQKEFEKRLAKIDKHIDDQLALLQEEAERKAAEQAELERKAAEAKAKHDEYVASKQNAATTARAKYDEYTASAQKAAAASQSRYDDYMKNTPRVAMGGGSTAYVPQTGIADWQNRAWQDSLGDRYNRDNFYSFNPNMYSPIPQFNFKS